MKRIRHCMLFIAAAVLFSSCATVFGGRISACQRHRPRGNEPTRQIRAVALIADILLWWPGAVIDFATGAIYRPCVVEYQRTDMRSRGRVVLPDSDDEDESGMNQNNEEK